MTQPRWHSLLEASTNTAVGFAGSYVLLEAIISPMFGLRTSPTDNLAITFIFTAWSVLRGYLTRRYFNWRLHGKPQR